MAKNVFQKKKRISHFQAVIDDFGKSEGGHSECFDYVSSIIVSMDSSFKSMNSDCSRQHAKRKSISNDETNTSSLNKSSSSQNEKKLVRKFTISRKFPLMEKSQKILRQIKHNRNISKPRAHLAGLPKSPLKTGIEKELSAMKKKESLKHVNKPESYSTRLSNISVHKFNDKKKFKSDCYKISSKKQNCSLKEETNTATYLDRYTGNENLCNAGNKLNTNVIIERDSINETKVLKDSENETSDSEYERFVKINKKGLRKKVVKKQKISATKKVKSVKKSKGVLKKNIRLEQYNFDETDYKADNDTPLPKNFKKAHCFKKSKITELNVENSDEESECDKSADVFTQDPSSESEAESNKTDRTQPLEAKYLSSVLQNTDSVQDLDTGYEATLPNVSAGNKFSISEVSHITVDNVVLQRSDVPLSVCNPDIGSDTTLPDISVNNEKSAPETSYVTVDNVLLKSYTPDVSLSHVRNSLNSGKTELNDSTSNLVIDLVSDSESEMGISSEYPILSAQIDENESVKGNLIDFTKNSDNCNNTVCKKISLTAIKQDNLDSEESDIEIIDIVSIKQKDECILNVVSNRLCCTDSKASGLVKNEAVENNVMGNINERNSEVIVKTEKLSEITDIKNNTRTVNNKYEPAYMTNICNDFNEDKPINFKQKTAISTEARELSETPSTYILSDDGALQKDIKKESESDDDVILLEPDEIPTISNFSSHKKIKTEVPATLMESLDYKNHSDHKILNNSSVKDELKLSMHSSSNVLSSYFCGEIYDEDQGCIDLQNMNESRLIEMYEKEIDTYKKIVQTEINVNASLKLFEARQAQRVKYFQSLVQKYVGNSHISSSKCLTKDCLKDFSSSSVTQTDILASSKLVSDIKPEVSNYELLENVQQSTVMLKQEPESSQEDQNMPDVKSNRTQALILLDEKCNVCGKEAIAACQRCAKVFFCSHECGRKFWIDGHVNECSK